MNTSNVGAVLRLGDHTTKALFLKQSDPDLEKLRAKLLATLRRLPAGAVLRVDFGGRTISSGAARTLLKPILVATGKGKEFAGRALVIAGLDEGGYEVQVMLESEGLIAVVDDDGQLKLMGRVERALEDTYAFLAKRSSALAREVSDAFGLNTVAAATNRLVRLADAGVVLRVAQESAEGGGLQYRYAAVK